MANAGHPAGMDKKPVERDDIDEALDAVAPRLRHLRTQRHRTLADVSSETGIGVSTLSRLESGLRRPTLDLLLPLARAYRVPLDDLVGAPPSGDPRVHPKPVRRGGMVFIPLTRSAGGVQAFKLILPGRRRTPPKQQRHDGFEWVYVLGGSLGVLDHEVGVDGRTRADTGRRGGADHGREVADVAGHPHPRDVGAPHR